MPVIELITLSIERNALLATKNTTIHIENNAVNIARHIEVGKENFTSYRSTI